MFCSFRMMSPRLRPAAAAGEFLFTSGTATPGLKNAVGTPCVLTCRQHPFAEQQPGASPVAAYMCPMGHNTDPQESQQKIVVSDWMQAGSFTTSPLKPSASQGGWSALNQLPSRLEAQAYLREEQAEGKDQRLLIRPPMTQWPAAGWSGFFQRFCVSRPAESCSLVVYHPGKAT